MIDAQHDSDAHSVQGLVDLGYIGARRRGAAGVCAVHPMLFTAALVVGITELGHAGRYCYASLAAAHAALMAWEGAGDPPGAWIKYKGVDGERLGPGCQLDAVVEA
jgi:hypothetical protein